MSAVVVPFPSSESADAVDARCAEHDPEWWFEVPFFDQAIEVCRSCPARTRCLNQALEAGETVGVWGGLTPAERAALPDAVIVPIRRSLRVVR